jgi:hypothetical protein
VFVSLAKPQFVSTISAVHQYHNALPTIGIHTLTELGELGGLRELKLSTIIVQDITIGQDANLHYT